MAAVFAAEAVRQLIFAAEDVPLLASAPEGVQMSEESQPADFAVGDEERAADDEAAAFR